MPSTHGKAAKREGTISGGSSLFRLFRYRDPASCADDDRGERRTDHPKTGTASAPRGGLLRRDVPFQGNRHALRRTPPCRRHGHLFPPAGGGLLGTSPRCRGRGLAPLHRRAPGIDHDLPRGVPDRILLGSDLAAGQRPQHVVPAGHWQGARPLPMGNAGFNFSLVGCTVAPGFDFADFEMPGRPELLTLFPEHRELILEFT